jgi:hypothetical protein
MRITDVNSMNVNAIIAWSQLFNTAIATNCRWRLGVGIPEYIEGGGRGRLCYTQQLVAKLRPRSKRHFKEASKSLDYSG